ncbi:MAG: pilus assembly protein TadB, partial [Gammaproteobacteria bacterium]|nr:pilus assembly protein TadB [Gammaproteobacteria bacterium]
MGWTVGTFLMLTVGSAAAFGLSAMVLMPAPLPLAAAAVGAVLPYIYVSRRRKKRFAKFEEHFPEAI